MAVLSSENLERTELFAVASQKLKACCSTYKNRKHPAPVNLNYMYMYMLYRYVCIDIDI